MTGDARPESVPWHSTLRAALLVGVAVGWGIAGAAYLSEAPLVVGALAGIACGLAGVVLLGRQR